MRKNKILLFYWALGLSSLPLHAQGPRPLQQVLDALSEQHQVRFNYLSATVEGFTVQVSPTALLSEALAAIAQQTGLTFDQLSDTIYVVRTSPYQRVCGTVLDEASGTPISGAVVYGTSFSVTNAEGEFALQARRGERLQVQMLGYHPTALPTDSLAHGDCVVVLLKPEIRLLPNITVQDLIARGIGKADNGGYVLSVDPLQVMPGLSAPDVFHSLLYLPGIQSANETVADLNIRGGAHDQNLLLLDGVRLYQPGHFFGLISAVNPHMLKRVEVIKQGTPARYGDGVSGTVAMSTAQHVPEQLEVQAGSDLLNANLSVALPLNEQQGLFVAGRRSLSPVAITPTFAQYTQRAFANSEVMNAPQDSLTMPPIGIEFGYTDVHLKYLGEWAERHRVEVFGWWISNDLEFLEQAQQGGAVVSALSSLQQRSQAAGAEYAYRWAGGGLTEVLVSVSDYGLAAVNADIVEDQRFEQSNEVLDYQAKVGHRYTWGAMDGNFGYQYNNLGVTNSNALDRPVYFEEVKDVITAHAGFWEHHASLSRSTQLRAGIRATYYYEPNRFFLDPRLRLEQSLGERITLEATAESKNQVVFQRIDLQTDFLGVEKRKWSVLDPTPFQIIRSQQASLGVLGEFGAWVVHAEGYAKEVEHIPANGQGMVNALSDQPLVGSYRALGVDALLKFRKGGFNTWLSYGYMHNQYTFAASVPQRFASTYEIPHAASLGLTYQVGSWQMAAAFHARSGRPYTALSPDQQTYAAPNQVRTPNYYRADASVQYHWQIGRRSLYFGVSGWNLLNRENLINRYFTPLVPEGWRDDQIIGLRRTLNASIRVKI